MNWDCDGCCWTGRRIVVSYSMYMLINYSWYNFPHHICSPFRLYPYYVISSSGWDEPLTKSDGGSSLFKSLKFPMNRF